MLETILNQSYLNVVIVFVLVFSVVGYVVSSIPPAPVKKRKQEVLKIHDMRAWYLNVWTRWQ